MNDAEQHLRLWMFISECQFWIILLTVLVSLIVISKALHNLLRRKRSHYFFFLISIIIANFITLLIILFDIFNLSFKGTIVCKVELFFSNSAACFINWLWLCLFTQRFFILFYPMKRSSHGFFGFLIEVVWRIGFCALLVEYLILTSWSLIFIKEVTMITADGQEISVCERNAEIMSNTGFKYLAIWEALITYMFPFSLTIIMDIAVLYHSTNSSFVVMSAENIRTEKTTNLQVSETFKIQSSQSIKESNHRRHLAVRRCLSMATTQVLLNAPYYTLQLLDEVYSLRDSSIYLDAFLYFIYLIQFSMIFVYTNFLVAPRTKSTRSASKSNRRSLKGVLSYTNSFRSEYTSSMI